MSGPRLKNELQCVHVTVKVRPGCLAGIAERAERVGVLGSGSSGVTALGLGFQPGRNCKIERGNHHNEFYSHSLPSKLTINWTSKNASLFWVAAWPQLAR